MSNSMLDTRQIFHMSLFVTTIALISNWSVSVVCVILPCMLWLLHPSGLLHQKLCMCFLCCVFLAELGLIPFNLELVFTLISPLRVRASHTPSLTHCISHTLATDRVILLASVRHRGQGITLHPTTGTSTPNVRRSY